MIDVGHLAAIWRYPVKSMRGEEMDNASLGWNGLDGDRQYAFYKATDGSRFPWLSGRDVAELVLHRAHYVEAASPRTSPVQVTVPAGGEFDVRDPALADRLGAAAGREVRLLQLGRGAFDSMPVSVVTRGTLDILGESLGRPLEDARFRINIVIDSDRREGDWLGGTLIFGEDDGPRVRVNRRIPRCRMITIDPATGEKDPAILRMVAERFDNEVGVYCAPDMTGTLHRGDRVRLAP
jgi:uncharacterized protein YcbX